MKLPITVILKISIWHPMGIGTNVDKHVLTLTHTHTYFHSHTWSQLTGAKDIAVGVKF